VLLIPAAQAYGSSGAGSIPPNSGIVFDISLTAVK
jgi:FKBP-type peptidyl-prolyl cis-trans isomerase